ncbi:MAG: hypothetical protein FWE14_12440 [Lachnospiraceae bacterium]|nr:hypothetical protein [Lachnospiraceae bacterium]
MTKQLFLVTILAILCIFLTACSKDERKLLGAWEGEWSENIAVDVDFPSENNEGIVSVMPSYVEKVSIEFFKDGTFTHSSRRIFNEKTWAIGDGTIRIGNHSHDYILKGNTLTIIGFYEYNDELILTKRK